jgi:long-chain acyl-CoA synthetase
METLRDVLTAQARRFEGKPFLEYRREKFSFGILDERTDRVATGLNRMGLRPGDRVMLLLSNRPEFIFFFLGAPKLGFIPVPLDPEVSGDDIEFILEHGAAAALVTEKRFRALKPRIPKTTCWIEVDDDSFQKPPFQGLSHGPVLGFWPDLSADDPALIYYVREPSGAFKPVVLTHRNLLSNCSQMIPPFRMNETDRFLCASPLCSLEAEVLLVLAPLLAGGCCVLPDPESSDMVREISDQQISILAAPSAFYKRISESADFSRIDLFSLRLAICHSGPAGDELLQIFQEQHDALIVETYNRAEATCLCCANPYTGVRKSGSLGLPLPGLKCAIIDDQGKEAPPGTTGEISICGPNVMKGYYRDSEGTARTVRNGWLRTGDFGYIDSDGYYWVRDSRFE